MFLTSLISGFISDVLLQMGKYEICICPMKRLRNSAIKFHVVFFVLQVKQNSFISLEIKASDFSRMNEATH